MDRKGFTLIELLIVVVIIGILAAIAIPRFGDTRERAYVSAMQSDINQIRTAQEMFYQDNDFTYAGVDDIGTGDGELDVTLSDGVEVDEMADAGDNTNWSVTVIHTASDQSCSYDTTGDNAGVIVCQ